MSSLETVQFTDHPVPAGAEADEPFDHPTSSECVGADAQ